MMKINSIFFLLVFTALPPLILAFAPIPAASLGQVEATVAFCGRVDSKSADKYEDLRKRIIKGVSQEELTETRNSSQYKESVQAVTTELGKLPTDKAVESCRAALRDDNK
jgi:hypothetical protein